MKTLVVLLLFFVAQGVFANGSHHWKTGPQGPIGPQGQKGDPGMDGLNGTNGIDGNDGATGATGPTGAKGEVGAQGPQGQAGPAGKDISENRLAVNVGAEVRWYDWKHVSLNSGYRRDLWHGGNVVDALIVQIKLGKSYEAREMERMRADLKAAMKVLEEKDQHHANAIGWINNSLAETEKPAKAVIRGSR